MKRLAVGDPAPDFTLPDHTGQQVTLSDVYRTKNVLLVFNIGFAWPHCTNHMSQLRHDYSKFKEMNTEVLVMVPNGPRTIDGYVNRHEVPYPILSDKGSKVASEYSQIKKFLIAGTPTVILVNTSGEILYTHYAKSLVEEPDNREPLDVLGWRPGSMAPAVQAL